MNKLIILLVGMLLVFPQTSKGDSRTPVEIVYNGRHESLGWIYHSKPTVFATRARWMPRGYCYRLAMTLTEDYEQSGLVDYLLSGARDDEYAAAADEDGCGNDNTDVVFFQTYIDPDVVRLLLIEYHAWMKNPLGENSRWKVVFENHAIEECVISTHPYAISGLWGKQFGGRDSTDLTMSYRGCDEPGSDRKLFADLVFSKDTKAFVVSFAYEQLNIEH